MWWTPSRPRPSRPIISWSLNAHYSQNPPSHNAIDIYPGDAWVDDGGLDAYDNWPASRTKEQFDAQANAVGGLPYWYNFARVWTGQRCRSKCDRDSASSPGDCAPPLATTPVCSPSCIRTWVDPAVAIGRAHCHSGHSATNSSRGRPADSGPKRSRAAAISSAGTTMIISGQVSTSSGRRRRIMSISTAV